MPDIYDSDKDKSLPPPEPEPILPSAAPVPKPKRQPSDYSEVMRKHKRTTNPLSPFMVRPHHVHVGILEEDEEILMVVREHPIVLVKKLLIILLMIVAPFLLAYIPFYNFLPERFNYALMLLWYLFISGITLETFVSWYYDLIIITDERIIDVDFLNLIYKNITFTKIDNIEDVTYNVTGVVPSLLDYGNVLVQTAGSGLLMTPQETKATLEIWNTPHPTKVVQLINEIMLEEEQEKLEGRTR